MQIRAEQLEQHLARGLKPLYTMFAAEAVNFQKDPAVWKTR